MSVARESKKQIHQIMTGNSLLTIAKICAWIYLISGYKIYPYATKNSIVLEYSDSNTNELMLRATFVPQAFRNKYRGLDMFDSEGYPLTNREDIKARRLELIPKYY